MTRTLRLCRKCKPEQKRAVCDGDRSGGEGLDRRAGASNPLLSRGRSSGARNNKSEDYLDTDFVVVVASALP